MREIGTVGELRRILFDARTETSTIGFVPTMGFLHAGHVSLIEASVASNDITVVSIFVNPLQFGAGEDLDSYPIDPEGDRRACADAGADIVFAPTIDEMFPPGMSTAVNVGGLSELFEGASRPTHFTGVATVVAKLFSIVGPCRAYFGAKDWQQLAVVRRMASDLSLPVEVMACPIVREPDGLAMSSRNVYLCDDERQQATILRRALDAGAVLVEGGVSDPGRIEAEMRDIIATAPLASLDYVAAVQAHSLSTDGPLRGEVRLLVAARFGRARLIDNTGCRTPAR